MSSQPTFDEMADTTLVLLETALRACGLPLSLSTGAYELVGTGAWHDAYRVTVPQHAQPFIVRIRKATAYDEPQDYDQHSNTWHAEYVSTSLYYMQANRAYPGICPATFLYHVSREITCTIETYMGRQLELGRLTRTAARRFGVQIGEMMRSMHQKKSHIQGTGELDWDGANLYGVGACHHPAVARRIEQSYNENILLGLTEQINGLAPARAWEKLRSAHTLRSVDEPIVLINRDITPENLTVQNDYRVGIIDPYPYLGNGTRFAAWFIHCYRFLLPAYAHTERYRRSHYDRYANVLASMADGFERGYIQHDEELARHITAERWLWTLEQAYDDMERLNRDDIPRAEAYKHGTQNVVQSRLQKALHTLNTLEF